jgi:hypothetical protein
MIAPREGLAGRALVVAFLVLAMAACGGAVSSPTGVAAGAGDVVTTGPVPTATPAASPASDAAEASEPAISTGGDCAALTDAAAGVQLWVTSIQAVTSDAQWQQLVADVHFDIYAFRERAELVAALPDAASQRVDPWSAHVGSLQELVRLAADAVATKTPFADGIGGRMVELAGALSVGGLMALQDAIAGAGC